MEALFKVYEYALAQWFAVKALLVEGTTDEYVAGVAIYGQKPNQSFSPVQIDEDGLLRTTPVGREVFDRANSNIAYNTNYVSPIVDCTDYTRISGCWTADVPGNVIIEQDEDGSMTAGAKYVQTYAMVATTIDGESRYQVAFDQQLVHSHVRITLDNTNGSGTSTVSVFGAYKTAVVR